MSDALQTDDVLAILDLAYTCIRNQQASIEQLVEIATSLHGRIAILESVSTQHE